LALLLLFLQLKRCFSLLKFFLLQWRPNSKAQR
jgi:hypothetical protein